MKALKARDLLLAANFADVDVGSWVPLADGEVPSVRGKGAAPELAAKGAQDMETSSQAGIPDSRCSIPRDGCDQQVVRAYGSPHYGIFMTKQLVLDGPTLYIPKIDAGERCSFTWRHGPL